MRKPAKDVRPGEFVMADLSRTFEPDVVECKVVSVSYVETHHMPAPVSWRDHPSVTRRVDLLLCPVGDNGLFKFGYDLLEQMEVTKHETENET